MSIYSTWRKGSFSAPENNCVELAWRKSSYSVGENECIELGASLTGGRVRDSKNPGGPTLRIGDLQVFLCAVRGDRFER